MPAGRSPGFHRWLRLLVVGLLAFLPLAGQLASGQATEEDRLPPTVAAASDLQFALEEIHTAYREETGKSLRLVFSASGNLTRQILQGAPFELFLSADEDFVRQLEAAGKTVDGGHLYAIGRLALFVPHGSPLTLDAELEGLRAGLADGRVQRFAIANPAHAPYGRAAEQALRHRELWEAVQPALVLGENVAQATQFATTGSAQGGLVAHSLVLAPGVSRLGTWILVPAEYHLPLRQRMVLLSGASEAARAFYVYLRGPAAREIFERYGFVVPPGTD